MTWKEVCEQPELQNLPYKIETNRWGQIIMSPATNRHYWKQSRIALLLSQMLKGGEVFQECAIQTTEGIRVSDAAWISLERCRSQIDLPAFHTAPELCVEVESPSNAPTDFLQKKTLYFNAGASEVWHCRSSGGVDFFTSQGSSDHSFICPDFPATLSLETGL